MEHIPRRQRLMISGSRANERCVMKRLILVLMTTFGLLGAACNALDYFGYTRESDNTHLTTRDFDGMIFAADNAAEMGLEFYFNDPIADYWTPTEAQVIALEAGLESFLRDVLSPDEYGYAIVDSLEFYKRQYLGILFEGGEPLIYANFFCSDTFDYWLEFLVAVEDGGECFFQVLYEPADGVFSNLRINGVA
jgi:hypothetical protein